MKSLIITVIIANSIFGALVALGNVKISDNNIDMPPEVQQALAKAKVSFSILQSMYTNSTTGNDLTASLPIDEIKNLQSYKEADLNLAQAAIYLKDNNVVGSAKASFTGLLKNLSTEYTIKMSLPDRG